jgi:hypothetical protein
MRRGYWQLVGFYDVEMQCKDWTEAHKVESQFKDNTKVYNRL